MLINLNENEYSIRVKYFTVILQITTIVNFNNLVITKSSCILKAEKYPFQIVRRTRKALGGISTLLVDPIFARLT